MTTHIKRVLTGVIIIPLLIGIIYFASSWVFTIFILFIALASLNEFYSMINFEAPVVIVFGNYTLTAALFCSLLVKDYLYIAILPLFIILPFALFIFHYQKIYPKAGDIGQIIIGPFYICLPLVLLVIIARLPQGPWWVFFILAVIFAGDTGSFYSGKLLGRHKLSRVSPGKTWEGAAGGLVSNIASAGIYAHLFFPSLSVTYIMVLGILIGISGQIGDLAESMLKRISKVKDSGRILPGHGGLLDRIDSLLFSIPILYLCLSYNDLLGS